MFALTAYEDSLSGVIFAGMLHSSIKMGSIGLWRNSNCTSHSQVTVFVIFAVKWLLCSFLVSHCAGNFNLYLNTDEVKRTLGKTCFHETFLVDFFSHNKTVLRTCSECLIWQIPFQIMVWLVLSSEDITLTESTEMCFHSLDKRSSFFFV